MPNNKPSRKTNKVHPYDKITLKTGRKGTDEVEVSIADFSDNIGASGESTPEVYYVEKTDNYELKRSVSASGEFEIQVRYKIEHDSDFEVNLFDTEPAHVYYDRYVDVIEEVKVAVGPFDSGPKQEGSIADAGYWALDRFYNEETGVTNALSGYRRSEGEVLLNITAGGTSQSSEVYFGLTGSRPKLIDITDTPSTFTFTSTASETQYTNYAWRIVTFRGVLIKDKLGL